MNRGIFAIHALCAVVATVLALADVPSAAVVAAGVMTAELLVMGMAGMALSSGSEAAAAEAGKSHQMAVRRIQFIAAWTEAQCADPPQSRPALMEDVALRFADVVGDMYRSERFDLEDDIRRAARVAAQDERTGTQPRGAGESREDSCARIHSALISR